MSTQFGLFDPDEPRARWTDPQTSHDAAASVIRITETRQAILDALKAHPEGLTDEEIATHYRGPQASPSGLRTRRAELADAELVVQSGRFGQTRSGRKTIIWEAT